MTIRAKRWRGQHFLTDTNMLKKIVSAADIQSTDTVVEIGAGTGNLTVLLTEKAKRVIAIEIDNDLIPTLRDRFCHSEAHAEESRRSLQSRDPSHSFGMTCGNVEIFHDDARTFNPANYGLSDVSYSVVANIPYNITSFLIRRLLEADPPPSRMILLVQKEVAQRICAVPPHMSLLAVAVQYYATPRIMFSVPRTCFSPRPNVDSAIVSFRRRPEPSLFSGGDIPLILGAPFVKSSQRDTPSATDFFVIVSTGFAHKRKLLLSNLLEMGSQEWGQAQIRSAKLSQTPTDPDPIFAAPAFRKQLELIFTSLDIPSTARAQELSLAQWKELCSALFPFTRQ